MVAQTCTLGALESRIVMSSRILLHGLSDRKSVV